jgi:Zn finger protein HypA/HybF involved in hydrogenase expression
MFQNPAEKVIGFQRLICKNHSCQHLLKTIIFLEGGETRVHGEIKLRSNGTSYYVCPKCKAYNFIILEGEDILLEKIVRCAMPKHELQQRELQKHQLAIDPIR